MAPIDKNGKKLELNDFALISGGLEDYLSENQFNSDLRPTFEKLDGALGRIMYSESNPAAWHDGSRVYVVARILDDQGVKDIPLILNSKALERIEWSISLMAFFANVEIIDQALVRTGFAFPPGSPRYGVFEKLQEEALRQVRKADTS